MPPLGRQVKLVIPLLVVAGVALGATWLYRQLQQTKEQLRLSQQDNVQLKGESEALTQQLNDLQAERKNLEDRISSLRSQLSSATTDLERSRVSLKELQDRYEQLSKERDQLQSQMTSVTTERDTTRQQLAHLEQDNADLERAVTHLRERLTLLDRDYRQLADKLAEIQAAPNSSLSVVSTIGPTAGMSRPSTEGSPPSAIPGTVELPPIVVRKDQAMMSMTIRGRLMEVNETHNFAIVDKGSEDGVRIGMVFDILRGMGPVGRATVVRLRPHLSACDIVRAKTTSPLQIGDLAVQSVP